jgi:protein gp37
MNKTPIEWTDYSWNPIRTRNRETGKIGHHCEHVDIDCLHCYAETWNRFRGTGLAFTRQNRERVDVFLDEKKLNQRPPREPAKIFVCDMTDLFGAFVPSQWIARIFAVIASHSQHIFQMLTKRPNRARDFFAAGPVLPNLWLGTSVGHRGGLDRLDALRRIPAAVRFVSFEPLTEDLGELDLAGIDWTICGAESAPRGRARPMQLDWVRNNRDQCIAAGVAFFFKQDAVRGKKVPLPELDGRQWRQFPTINKPRRGK